MISLEDIDNILELEQEIQLHKVLSENEYIITIIEHFFEENMLTIVTEYAKSTYIITISMCYTTQIN